MEVKAMTRSMVFVASSSEGLDVAKKLEPLLQGKITQRADIEPWTGAFELTATYIESLEKTAAQADFAVLVLTPDDVTTSRRKNTLAPRDNVIFELGLFMGHLGRERCFIIQEDKADLKLPTDLLGVKSATFTRPSDGNWQAALGAKCALIAARVIKLGPRNKLNSDAIAAQARIGTFCKRVAGTWWERITIEDASAISFFHIEQEALFNSVSIRGNSYDNDGALAAHWNSVMARVDPNENKILYHWNGWHRRADIANVPFHGLGEMVFESSTGTLITRGGGKFWKVDEAHPDKTIITPIQLRRVTAKGVISTMTTGKEKDIRPLVARTLAEW